MLSLGNTVGNFFERQYVGVCMMLRKFPLIEKNVSRAHADDASSITRRDDDGRYNFGGTHDRRTRNACIRSIHLIERRVEQQNFRTGNNCLCESDTKNLSGIEGPDSLLNVVSKQHPIDR